MGKNEGNRNRTRRANAEPENARPVLNFLEGAPTLENKLKHVMRLYKMKTEGLYQNNGQEPVPSWRNGRAFFRVNRPPPEIEERMRSLPVLPDSPVITGRVLRRSRRQRGTSPEKRENSNSNKNSPGKRNRSRRIRTKRYLNTYL